MHHHEENDQEDSETLNVGMKGVGSKGGHFSRDIMQENERETGVNNLKTTLASTERNTLNFSFCLKLT
jgi:hypothetical protein